MQESVAVGNQSIGVARDLVELGKPRITLMVVFTTALGSWLAPGSLPIGSTVAFLAATALLVAAANTLNCYVERDSDALMVRTRDRALPAGRLAPRTALLSGLALGGLALTTLLVAANLLTFALGAVALSTYVLLYTPLKRISPWALHIGAVPGAIPPLMGWTAVTGRLAVEGWILFGILFFWQLPHFMAISIYLREDYRRGGLKVLPVARGTATAWRHLFVSTIGLVLVSLAAVSLGMAGQVYLGVAVVLGAGFLYFAVRGLDDTAGGSWARRTFLYSVVYLPVLITAVLLDAS
jgi:protoheme IX farnesyltransferase